jgi:hypothetical protein
MNKIAMEMEASDTRNWIPDDHFGIQRWDILK